MTASLDQIHQSIGALTANVAGLREDLRVSEERADVGRREASASRKRIHERLDGVGNEVTKLAGRVERLEQDVRGHAEVIGAVRQSGNERNGMLRLGRWLWAAAKLFVAGLGGATLVAWWQKIVMFLGGGVPR